MSYMICKECGKEYEIMEGKTSFNYERCECGGKLEYSANLKESSVKKDKDQSNIPISRIKWKGVLIGFLFLFFSLIISVLVLFGNNIPTNVSDITSEILTYFSIITIILTIAAGSVSAYSSGSKKYIDGVINGGMVGVILGFILGFVGGILVFMSGVIIFGLLSMLGGFIGVIPRKRSK
ncbi:MAG: hypothetical protein LLF83_11705 [Methanobacterium sp.]|nr:hypothetical protein [Methanobacterium sp.]